MKVKISGFYDEIGGSLDKQIALIKEFGEEYLCPRSVDGKNIANYTLEEFEREIKPRLIESNIKFSSIGSPIGKIGINDNQAYEKQKNQLVELVKIAQSMDCKYIRVFSFFYGSENPDSCVDKAIEKMRGFLEIVKDTGVFLMHENEKKVVGDVPSRVVKLYEALKSENFVLCFDASNYIQCDVDVKTAFDLLKDKTVYYHIKDCSKYKVEVPVGLGDGQYEYIFEELKNRKYEGFLTMEPHTAKYAILKPFVYFIPFMPLIMNNYFKAFRMIDKAKGVSFWKRISLTEVFKWQYYGLKEMIK